MSSPGIEPSGIEAKSQLLKQRIEKRMQECEVLLADLEKVKARLLLERGQKLTEQDIEAFVNMILQGDVEDIEFRRRLIDNLVYKVYVSDDYTTIYFNIKGGSRINEITLEDTKVAIDNAERVLTQRDPARQAKPKSNTKVFGLGFLLIKVFAFAIIYVFQIHRIFVMFIGIKMSDDFRQKRTLFATALIWIGQRGGN